MGSFWVKILNYHITHSLQPVSNITLDSRFAVWHCVVKIRIRPHLLYCYNRTWRAAFQLSQSTLTSYYRRRPSKTFRDAWMVLGGLDHGTNEGSMRMDTELWQWAFMATSIVLPHREINPPIILSVTLSSHYPHSHCPILILLNTSLGSDTYQFCKWFDLTWTCPHDLLVRRPDGMAEWVERPSPVLLDHNQLKAMT